MDEEAIAEFVSEQAKEYDTYGKKRKFTTVQGIELNLSRGAYGWKTDREEEIKALTEAIQNGETVDKEPAYLSLIHISNPFISTQQANACWFVP